MTLKELYEQRAKSEKEARDLVNLVESEKRAWGAEDETKWKAIMTRDAELKSAIQRQERLDAMKSDLDRRERHGLDRRSNPASGIDDQDGDDRELRDRNDGCGEPTNGPTERQRRSMFNAWGRRQAGKTLTREERDVCKRFGFNPGQRELHIRMRDTEDFREHAEKMRDTHPRLLKRDLSIGGGVSTGSGTIPTGFVNRLEQAMLYYAPMFRVAELMRTDTGNDLPWPTANDTSNEGVLLAEATSFGASVDPTLAAITLKAFKFSSKPIFISSELMNDSAFNLDVMISNMLGERLGRIGNKKATIGAGTTEPKGIVVESTLGVTAASATAIADTELLSLVHSVDVSYRDLPSAGFMMNDGILLAIRKLKDSYGQFIFQSGLQLGVPDRLLGYPVYVNNHMQATVATNTKTIIFGALDNYKIRQVRDIRLMRLNERYADLDQIAFIAYLRMDGRLINAGTNPVKHLLQA